MTTEKEPHFLNKPVPYWAAAKCIKAYEGWIDPNPTDKKTLAVAFRGPGLADWVAKLDQSKYDELWVCFGVYDENMIDNFGVQKEYLNRLTTFLVPYKNNKPVSTNTGKNEETGKLIDPDPFDPFNIGELHP
ncbi:MAG: hypothetical protein V4687_15165 [Bacteroidota bacterium]